MVHAHQLPGQLADRGQVFLARVPDPMPHGQVLPHHRPTTESTRVLMTGQTVLTKRFCGAGDARA